MSRFTAGEFMEYALRGLKEDGAIRHIGLSTHNPAVAQAGGPER